MELQLAIDLLNKEEAAELAKKVEEYVDIVEIGTPIVINEGLPAVQHLNENINNAKVLADLKIMDAADYEVSQAVKFGADVVLLTTKFDSAIGEIADTVVELPSGTKHDADGSDQPLGSLFEQSSQIFLDSVIIGLMDQLDVDETTMQT
ncbi:orotidine 5'-phosphate decarboxylase [Staphylococcus epidermidis]|uniref:orotidine 5'-phosphate decarboxylase / HUMPS family protein n=1 Tax=Staphylococcus epidermidis TaxID=1282 RepID=UPI002095E08E|nr:orotidine 5'-phosphate decarboxylase / HUMPS family protein [Staphylococcus epidermidis]MCO6333905.1 orotidine 5'-phosphate decarboxylase [Staphylococcus epidermidis]MCO6337917.1 orotidine 5'-phosphate decarboxylase [Staphylococcus epidermidis]